MTRHALPLAALTLLSATTLGCRHELAQSPHEPQITLVDRDYDDLNHRYDVKFKTGDTFTFRNVESHGSPYWVIFLDQTPCELSNDPNNPKAYKGTTGHPPSCTIAFKPDGRDRLYRYTVYVPDQTATPQPPPPPALSIPYHTGYSCRPACNGTN